MSTLETIYRQNIVSLHIIIIEKIDLNVKFTTSLIHEEEILTYARLTGTSMNESEHRIMIFYHVSLL